MCMHLIRVLIPRVSVIRIHWTVEYWLWFWIQYIFLAVNEYEIGWMGMRFSSIIIYIAVTLFLVNNAIANSSTHRELKDECGVTYTDRIIGGKNASLGQYPWLARIGYKCKQQHIRWFFPIKPYSHYIVHKYLIAKGKRGYIHGCGGALIDRCHIVTAAHCVKNLGRRIKLCVCVCEVLNRCALTREYYLSFIQYSGTKLFWVKTTHHPISIAMMIFAPILCSISNQPESSYRNSTIRGGRSTISLWWNSIDPFVLQVYILPAKICNFSDDRITFSEWVLPLCIPSGDLINIDLNGQIAEVGQFRYMCSVLVLYTYVLLCLRSWMGFNGQRSPNRNTISPDSKRNFWTDQWMTIVIQLQYHYCSYP